MKRIKKFEELENPGLIQDDENPGSEPVSHRGYKDAVTSAYNYIINADENDIDKELKPILVDALRRYKKNIYYKKYENI